MVVRCDAAAFPPTLTVSICLQLKPEEFLSVGALPKRPGVFVYGPAFFLSRQKLEKREASSLSIVLSRAGAKFTSYRRTYRLFSLFAADSRDHSVVIDRRRN